MESMGKREFYFLMYLKESGYLYIARDKGVGLYAYTKKPEKYGNGWTTMDGTFLRADTDLFPFLHWDDEEPTLIQDLLEKCGDRN